MSRIRSIKPSLFIDDRFADCSIHARFLFTGLPCIADSEGRLEDRPRRIKTQLLPYDDVDIDALLDELVAKAFIVRYEVEGKRCIWIVDFKIHQQPHINEKKKGSELPPPPTDALPAGVTLPPDDPPPQPRPRFSKKDRTCTILGSDSPVSNANVAYIDKNPTGGGSISLTHDAAQWLALELMKQKPQHNIFVAPDPENGILQVTSALCQTPVESIPLPRAKTPTQEELMAIYTHARPKTNEPSALPQLLPA